MQEQIHLLSEEHSFMLYLNTIEQTDTNAIYTLNNLLYHNNLSMIYLFY